MAAIAVGTQVVFCSEDGPLSAEVVEYDEGKDAGDYYLLVKSTAKSQANPTYGTAPVFNTWSVLGSPDEVGAFTLA